MARFSEKHGFSQPRSTLQIETMDLRLRNRLWNVVHSLILENLVGYSDENSFCVSVYDQFLGLPTRNLPLSNLDFSSDLHERFSAMRWFEVYDFLEFCTTQTVKVDGAYRSTTRTVPVRDQLIAQTNVVLEQERSGYRFVGAVIAPISDEIEILEIETAARNVNSHEGASTHIKAALNHYANRDDPDFRNSVKESISAVEATAKWLAEDPSASCGTALTKIEQSYGLHGALKSGFSSLYGWTSQDGGARHALMDRETITEADARYMLVSCSAFCNYLVSLKAHGPRAEA